MIAPSAATLRDLSLRCLRERGDMTADECAAALGYDVLSIRPRFSELRRLGQIHATPKRRHSSRGIPSTVWTAP
jgi:predicted ArsR family transcriptional regulator